jgi:hypothetical protein
MANLPADSLYRKTVRVSLLTEMVQLWKRAAQHEQGATQKPSVEQRMAA